jgi:hypothetical protein
MSKLQYGEDDIQVKKLSLSTHCPAIERRILYLLARCRIWRGWYPGKNTFAEHTLSSYREEDTLPISKVQIMERVDIQVETLSLSTHCPAIERRILYLLARCRVWRGMISWRKPSRWACIVHL